MRPTDSEESSTDDDVPIESLTNRKTKKAKRPVKRPTSSDFSSSSEDEVPIESLVSGKNKNAGLSNAMEELVRQTREECEFCSEISYNMYDGLVHNASHITVSLNPSIPHCMQCNLHFESQDKLEAHNETHRYQVPDIIKDIIKTKPIVKVDNSVTDLLVENKVKIKETECIKTSIPNVKEAEIPPYLINKDTVIKDIIKSKPIVKVDNLVTDLLLENKVKIKENECSKTSVPGVIESTILPHFINNNIVAGEDIDNSQRNGDIHIEVGCAKIDTEVIEIDDDDDEENDLYVSKRIIGKGFGTGDDITRRNSLKIQEDLCKQPIIQCDNTITKLIKDKMSNENVNNKEESNESKIKSKLLFEDDNICDLTLSDNENEEFKFNKIMLGSKVDNETGPSESSYQRKVVDEGNFLPSTHYDQLVRYGLFVCAFCEKAFPNRFQKIIHEGKHVKIDALPKTLYKRIRVCQFCDQYIVGNYLSLKRHRNKKHSGEEAKLNYNVRQCPSCNLRCFSKKRHFLKYHLVHECPLCSKLFETYSAVEEHKKNCTLFNNVPTDVTKKREIKVCNICSFFEISNRRHRDIEISDYSEQGKRVRCEKCEKEFFELKCIKYSYSYVTHPTFKKKQLTNEMRLKNIQQRLKTMKMLSKT